MQKHMQTLMQMKQNRQETHLEGGVAEEPLAISSHTHTKRKLLRP